MSKKVIVKIEEITGYTNPQVIFLENWPDCVSKKCEIAGNQVELVIQDGCTDVCFDVMIRDGDECSDCPSVIKQVCLCDENTVLTNCQTCKDGVIQDICTDSELAGGKICTPDGCNCPSAKPYWNETLEKCVVCIEGTTHPTDACLVCRNGQWEEKCDDCVNGDCGASCDDPNAVWNPVTKNCDCKPGFIDSVNGCIVAPECQPGDVLEPCQECVDGEIKDVICPDPNQICVDGDCVDKPCEGDCKNGLDCAGENCGCDEDTEKCVSCDDNPNALGCDDDGGCTGGCSDSSECGPGCTCVDGKCVSCDNFPCSECGDYDGCACNDGVNCEGDGNEDCEDDLTIEKEDCGITGTLKKKGQCQCEVISSALTVEDARVVDEIPEGETSGGQTEGRVVTQDMYYASFKVDIRKGIANSYAQHLNLPLFSNDVVFNELPTGGSVVLTITPVFKSIQSIDGQTVISTYDGVSSEKIKSISGKSEVLFTDSDEVFIGRTLLDSNGFGDRLIGYKITAKLKDLAFDSGCVYKDTTIYETPSRESLLSVGYKGHDEVRSSTSRNPLFTWSRGSVVFRRLYIKPESNGFFVDKLYGPQKFTGPGTGDGQSGEQELSSPEGELISIQDYTLEVDCGCDKLDVEENLVICDIEFEKDNHFRLEQCNKKLLLDNLFDVCPINQNLNSFGWGNNHPSQTYYILKVNGVQAAKFIYDNGLETLKEVNTNIVWADWEKTFTDEITNVSLELNHDSGCKIEVPLSIEKPTPKIDLQCQDNGTVTAVVSDTTPGIDYIEINSIKYFMSGNQVSITGLAKGTSHTFLVVYDSGCSKELTLTDNCCESATSITIQDSIPGVVGTNKASVSFTTSGFGTISSVSLDGLQIPGYTVGDPVLVGSGTHTITVTDVSGCEKSETFVVPEITDDSTVEFDINPICINGSSSLIVNSTPNTPFTIKTPTGSNINGVTDNSGVGTIAGLSTSGEYLLETVGGNTVNVPVELEVIPSLQVTSFVLSASNSYCTGETIEVSILGTPGATVTFVASGATGDTTIQLDSLGNGTAQFVYPTAGNYTINTVTIDLNGQCSSSLTGVLNVSIVDSPQIIDVTQECIAPISATSDVKLTVVAQTGLALTATEQGTGTEYTFLPTAAPQIYEATITEGSGKTVTITATNGSCEDSLLFNIDTCDCPFVQPPDLGSQTVYYLCNGNPASLSATAPVGTTLKWYSDAGLVNLIGTGSPVSVATAGTYYVVSETADGCQSEPVSAIVIDGDIILSVDADSDMCLGQTYVVSANVIGDTVGLEYLFKVDGVVVQNFSTQSTYIYNADSVGTRTFEVTSRRFGDCETVADTTSDVIVCCTNINISVSGDTTNSCESLITTVTGGTAPYTYAWSGTGDQGTVISQTTQNFDPSSLQAGEFITLSLVVTDNNGCTEQIYPNYHKCIFPALVYDLQVVGNGCTSTGSEMDAFFTFQVEVPCADVELFPGDSSAFARINGSTDFNGPDPGSVSYTYVNGVLTCTKAFLPGPTIIGSASLVATNNLLEIVGNVTGTVYASVTFDADNCP